MIRLESHLIQAGKPIPSDCYDGHGRLVLKSGSIVDSQRLISSLLEQGLFVAPAREAQTGDAAHPSAASPIRRLTDCYLRLEDLLMGAVQIAGGATTDGKESDSPPSATQQLAAVLNGSSSAFRDIPREQDNPFIVEVMKIAGEIQAICLADAEAEAALGAIHLDCVGSRYSISHALGRAIACELLASSCRIPSRNRLRLGAAALTCDLGMLRLHDELRHQATPLLAEQQAVIANHPHETLSLLGSLGVVDPSWTNAVIQHHEFPDGSGYPAGLSGKLISPWARILKIADTYAAMVTPQARRAPLLSKEALREFFHKRGSELDEEMTVLFVKLIGVFPPGSIVRLQSGEIAVVTQRGENPRAPRVKSVVGPRGAPLNPPLARNTESVEHQIAEVLHRSAIPPVNAHALWA